MTQGKPVGPDTMDPEAIRSAIEDRYMDFTAAMKAGDVSSLLGLLDAEFTWRLLDGEVLTAAQTSSALEDFLSRNVVVDMSVHILGLTLHADEACARVEERTLSAPAGALSPEGGMETIEELDEVWRRGLHGWRLLGSHVLQSHATPLRK